MLVDLAIGFVAFTKFALTMQLVLLSWSYIRVILQDPGSVPENWKVVPEQSVEEGCSVSLPANAGPENVVSASSSSGTGERRQAVGFCSHCQNGKPPRCHHCSVCMLTLTIYFLYWK